jgi:hypothetical protein
MLLFKLYSFAVSNDVGTEESRTIERVTRMGEMGVLVGLREGKRSPRKPGRSGGDNVKIIFRARGWPGFCWRSDMSRGVLLRTR